LQHACTACLFSISVHQEYSEDLISTDVQQVCSACLFNRATYSADMFSTADQLFCSACLFCMSVQQGYSADLISAAVQQVISACISRSFVHQVCKAGQMSKSVQHVSQASQQACLAGLTNWSGQLSSRSKCVMSSSV
jgi:hypothetical protein